MRTTIITLALALAGSTAALAQGTTTPAPSADHQCLMTANDQTWTSLNLTPEQTKQVKDIQANCKKECDAMMKDKGTMDHAAMDKHETEIKAVLKPEQYDKWVAWCNTQPMKSDKGDMKK